MRGDDATTGPSPAELETGPFPAELETERLVLRTTAPCYAEAAFAEFTDEITLYLRAATPTCVDETRDYYSGAEQRIREGADYEVNIFRKGDSEFLGGGGLIRANTATPELGIWIKKSAHRCGYAKEALSALVAWAEANLTYEYILYPAVDVNWPSRRTAESLGGVYTRNYMDADLAGDPMSLVEYRIPARPDPNACDGGSQ